MKGDLGNGKKVEFLDPKDDFAFYWLFGRKEETRFVKDFLSGLFNEEITEIEHLDPRDRGEIKDDKEIIMDVLVKIPGKYYVNIEMQRANTSDMSKRTAYYGVRRFREQARIFEEQLKKGDGYEKLEKVVTVNILDYVDNRLPHKYHNYLDLFRYYNYLDLLETYFFELPKIKLDKNRLWDYIGKNRLLDWLIYFKYYNNEKVMKELLEKNKMIKAAVDELELNKILSDPEARRRYEAARKRELDYNSAISAAEERGEKRGMQRGIQLGRQQGIQEGRQQGIQEGRQQGIQEGRQKERQLVINYMLEKGHTLDEIRDMTPYTLDEIQEVIGITKTQIKELQEKTDQTNEVMKDDLKKNKRLKELLKQRDGEPDPIKIMKDDLKKNNGPKL